MEATTEQQNSAATAAAADSPPKATPLQTGRHEVLKQLIHQTGGAYAACDSSLSSEGSYGVEEVDMVETGSESHMDNSSNNLASFGDLTSFPSDSDIDDPDFLPADNHLDVSSYWSSDRSDVYTSDLTSEGDYNSNCPYGPSNVRLEDDTDHPSMYGSDKVSNCGESTRPGWHSQSCDSGSSGKSHGLPSQCPGDEDPRYDDLSNYCESDGFPAVDFSGDQAHHSDFEAPRDHLFNCRPDYDYSEDESKQFHASSNGQSNDSSESNSSFLDNPSDGDPLLSSNGSNRSSISSLESNWIYVDSNGDEVCLDGSDESYSEEERSKEEYD